mmetsp:Transcript_69109/g.123054  ORF Transcript_69109/g.123054 Transcript_69109/m.123054 type:complete len:88 (+) Transcript_69109:137-400(+)
MSSIQLRQTSITCHLLNSGEQIRIEEGWPIFFVKEELLLVISEEGCSFAAPEDAALLPGSQWNFVEPGRQDRRFGKLALAILKAAGR